MTRWIRIRTIVAFTLLGLLLAPVAQAMDATPGAGGGLPECANSAGDSASNVETETDELAEWLTLPLTDARTGVEYTIADYVGCTILVETMATWCINCLMQLTNVHEAFPNLDPDRFVVIAISIETELSAEELATYADNSEFNWLFSVASPDMLKAIVDEFGRTAIVPPSTPHVFIGPDGKVGDLRTGGTSAEDIVRIMTELGGQ